MIFPLARSSVPHFCSGSTTKKTVTTGSDRCCSLVVLSAVFFRMSSGGFENSCPGESPSRLMPVQGRLGGSSSPDSSGETEGLVVSSGVIKTRIELLQFRRLQPLLSHGTLFRLIDSIELLFISFIPTSLPARPCIPIPTSSTQILPFEDQAINTLQPFRWQLLWWWWFRRRFRWRWVRSPQFLNKEYFGLVLLVMVGLVVVPTKFLVVFLHGKSGLLLQVRLFRFERTIFLVVARSSSFPFGGFLLFASLDFLEAFYLIKLHPNDIIFCDVFFTNNFFLCNRRL